MKALLDLTAVAAVMLVAATALPGLTASAQTRSQVYGSPLIQQAMTVYVRADAGMSTYESEAAGSNETQAATTYTVGGWVGESRMAGIMVSSSTQEVPFSLNESRMDSAFHDVRAQVRLWWFTPSVGVSLSEIDVSRDDSKTISLYSTGISAGIGMQIPLYTRVVVYGDAQSVTSSKGYDKIDQDTKLGSRNELDVGVSFDVTDRLIDLLAGYKVRQYSIETADATFAEDSQGAYVGLRLGLYF